MDIDKYQGAVADVEEFNRYAERAMYEYISSKYAEFEITQRRTDDLRLFIRRSTLSRLPGPTPVYELPQNYRHLLLVELNTQSERCDVPKIIYAKKITADIKGYAGHNYYYDYDKNYYYQIIDRNLYLYTPLNDSEIQSVSIEYIANIGTFYINPDDFTDNGFELDDYVCEQLLAIMTRQYRGDTFESAYQVSVAEQQFKRDNIAINTKQ
jgi:hypothetical protein